MSSPLGEWGHRLTTPDLAPVAGWFLADVGGPADPSIEANFTPPDGYLFSHTLTAQDRLLVSRITVNHTTLHPQPEHHRAATGVLAGKIVLGGRIRFFHTGEPVMDLVDKDGSNPQALVKLLIGNTATFNAIGFRELPIPKRHSLIIPPRRLYTAALFNLRLPPLPHDVAVRLDNQLDALRGRVTEAPEPRSRSRE